MRRDIVIELINQEALRQMNKEEKEHREQATRRLKIILISGMIIIALLLGYLLYINVISN